MKCKEIHIKLISYADGTLLPAEKGNIEQHLITCSECSGFLKEIEQSIDIINNEKETELNPYLFTRIMAKINSRHEAVTARKNVPVFTKVLQPAILSVLLLLGIYTGYFISQSELSENTYSEIVPFLNEMDSEPIESFLMKSDGNE